MTETNVFELTQPGTFSDPLTEVLRNGVRTLLGQAVEAKVAAWLGTHTCQWRAESPQLWRSKIAQFGGRDDQPWC